MSAILRDISGQKFNFLTAIKVDHKERVKKGTKIYWLCKCDCGTSKVISYSGIVYGKTKSCGCWGKKASVINNQTHKMSDTRFYSIYKGLQSRCKYPKGNRFSNYGGRGIKCEWQTFEQFRDDMLESYLEHCKKFSEKETTIDRIDNDGNYCKDNCKWQTYKEQANNTRKNVFITFNNETHTITQWAEKIGLKPLTLAWRFRTGWTKEKALNSKKFINQYI